jgi:hypothetical protein
MKLKINLRLHEPTVFFQKSSYDMSIPEKNTMTPDFRIALLCIRLLSFSVLLGASAA